MEAESDWTVWQIVDSGLPTGGFAHSLGLEAAASLGHVVSPEHGRCSSTPGPRQGPNAAGQTPLDLFTYIDAQMESLAAAELPFVFEGNTAARPWVELDRLMCVRMHINPPALQASISQGGAFLRIAATGLAQTEQARLELDRMRDAVSAKAARGLFAPLFGVVTRLLGVGAQRAQRMFLFLALRDMVSAAKRLALVGPMAAVGLQTALSARLDAYLAAYSDRPATEAHQTFPLGEVLHSGHNSLYRKLFLS